jgi:hypothetical protein
MDKQLSTKVGSQKQKGTNQGCMAEASSLRIRFLNIEGLRKKAGSKDFFDVLAAYNIFSTAER